MKIELYTKDKEGKAEKVGESYVGGFPIVGATLNSSNGIKYLILDHASEYDRNGKFVGCSAEVIQVENNPRQNKMILP